MQTQKLKYSLVPAFTLVELIVVIVILSILATISFLSFSSYSSSSRDSVRLSDITSIAKGLTLQYSIGGSYIIPDNSVSLLSGSTTIIGYQGKAGYNTLNSIKLSTSNNNSGKDPLDNTYYTYNINSNKNKYQLSGFLENKGNIINRTSSINNSNIENNNFELSSFGAPEGSTLWGAEGNGVEGIYENNSVIPVNTGIFHLLSYDNTSSFFDIKDLPAGRQVPVTSTRMTNDGIVFDNNSIPHLTSPRTGEELSSLPLTKGELEGVFQINQTYATTYTNRYPYTKGDSIGVILNYTGTTTSNTTNSIYTPIEDSGTGIDISSGTLTSGKIVINNNVDSSTGVSVVSMSGYTAVNTTTAASSTWSNWDGSKNTSYISLDGGDVSLTDSVLIDTNKVLITYIKNYKVYGIIGNFDGNNISYTTPVILYSGTDVYQAQFAKLDTNKVLITYRNAANGYANVLTISGNTISVGAQFNYSSSVTVSVILTPLSQTSVLAAYRGAGNTGFAFVFNISGTTITKGSEYSFSSYGQPNGILAVNSTQGIISYIGNTGAGYFSYIIVANVSGTTLTFGSPTRIDSSTSNERYPLGIIQIGSYYIVGNGSYTTSRPLELSLFSLAGSTFNIENKLTIYSNGYGIGGTLTKLNNQELIYISKNPLDSNYENAKIIGLSGTGLSINNSIKISSEPVSNATSNILIDDSNILNIYTDTVGWPSQQSKANILKK